VYDVGASVMRVVVVVISLLLCFVSTLQGQVANQRKDKKQPSTIHKSSGELYDSAVKRVEPSYPPDARAAGVTGSVIVRVVVDEQGNVVSARAVSGPEPLKESAVLAAIAWKWESPLSKGKPVRITGTIKINFQFEAKKFN